jgi:hypothetical protein
MLTRELKQFEMMIPWAERLPAAGARLSEPMDEGKWSALEMIAHLHYWDIECLRMVPQIKQGAVLTFTAIQPLNEEAAAYGRSQRPEELVRQFVETRRELIDAIRSHPEPQVTFTLDGETSDLTEFVRIFVHHDGHHREQLDTFLEQYDF